MLHLLLRNRKPLASMQDIRLQIHIDNTIPIKLSDLNNALSALNNQYAAYVKPHSDKNICGTTCLYIKEVRKGSAIFELIDISPVVAGVIPFMENANTIIGFAEHCRDALAYFLGKGKYRPDMTADDCRNMSNLVNPIIADHGAKMDIGTVINGDLNVYVSTNSTEANAIQNAVRTEIKKLSATEQTDIHERVVMTWAQASSNIANNTKNKGVIDAIYPDKALKVLFTDEETKRQMLYGSENPFKYAYEIDVIVETSQGKPVAYRVVKLHEAFEI